MPEKYRGNPIMTLRLPSWQVAGLKWLANNRQTSVSTLIRTMIENLLEENGITEGFPSEIPGQIRTSDLLDE